MYKDLGLKEKSELFKLMVSNGITDINEIERIYNSYQGGGSVETPQQKLFNKSTIDDRPTNNTNIKDTKHIRTVTLPGIYHYIPFAERYANNFLKKFEHLSNEEIAERLYNNMYQGYNVDAPLDLKRRLEKTVLKNEKESENVKNPYIPEMDALFAEYLNIPKNKRRDVSFSRGLSDSEYKPTKNSRDITYKAFNRIYREDQKALIDRVFKGIDREEGFFGMFPVEAEPLEIGENSNSKILSTYGLGTHTIGRGLDPNTGEYVSYYDLWDLAPIGSSGGKDQSLGIGKPIHIYDRIYLDDYFNLDFKKSSAPQKGDYYGGYLPEITVTGNKKSKGGKINKFDEGGLNVTLPEVVVSPRNSYYNYTGEETNVPTWEEFAIAKQEEARDNAYLKMLDQKVPLIPRVPSQDPWSKFINRSMKYWLNSSDEDVMKVVGVEERPHTCAYTATGQYDKCNQVSGNITFKNNPRKYGFKETNNPRVGDLIQFSYNDIPYHMGMVTGFDANGEPVISYSNGDIDAEAMRHDMDTWKHDFDGADWKYFTFKGNNANSLKWRKEYKRKYKNR